MARHNGQSSTTDRIRMDSPSHRSPGRSARFSGYLSNSDASTSQTARFVLSFRRVQEPSVRFRGMFLPMSRLWLLLVSDIYRIVRQLGGTGHTCSIPLVRSLRSPLTILG